MDEKQIIVLLPRNRYDQVYISEMLNFIIMYIIYY